MRSALLRGAVTNLVNPKSVTFVVALLPQFVDRSLGHIPLQFAVLGAIFVAFEVLVDGTVGLASGRIGGWLSRRHRIEAVTSSMRTNSRRVYAGHLPRSVRKGAALQALLEHALTCGGTLRTTGFGTYPVQRPV